MPRQKYKYLFAKKSKHSPKNIVDPRTKKPKAQALSSPWFTVSFAMRANGNRYVKSQPKTAMLVPNTKNLGRIS